MTSNNNNFLAHNQQRIQKSECCCFFVNFYLRNDSPPTATIIKIVYRASECFVCDWLKLKRFGFFVLLLDRVLLYLKQTLTCLSGRAVIQVYNTQKMSKHKKTIKILTKVKSWILMFKKNLFRILRITLSQWQSFYC